MWTFEQTCSNEITIYFRGDQIATIVNDDNDITQQNLNDAQFICQACNAAEKSGAGYE